MQMRTNLKKALKDLNASIRGDPAKLLDHLSEKLLVAGGKRRTG